MGTRTVSPKNTKQQILDAYEEILKKYERLQRQTIPRRKRQRKQQQKLDAYTAADQLSSEKIITDISRLKLSVAQTLDAIATSLTEEAAKYDELRRAQEFREEELETLDDKKVTFDAIEIMIAEHESQKQQFEKECREQREAFEREVETHRSLWADEIKQQEKAHREAREEQQKVREREQADFEYELQLKRQRLENELCLKRQEAETQLQQERADFKLEVQTSKLEVQKRRALAQQQEQEILSLRQRASEFEIEIKTLKQSERAAAQKEAKVRFDQELELVKQKFESEKSILEFKVKTLESHIIKQDDQVTLLSVKLEDATSRVRELASQVVKSVTDLIADGVLYASPAACILVASSDFRYRQPSQRGGHRVPKFQPYDKRTRLRHRAILGDT